MSDVAARQCNGKQRYKSLRRAEEVAREVQPKYGHPMHAYPCRFCRGFHVGSVEREHGRGARMQQVKA